MARSASSPYPPGPRGYPILGMLPLRFAPERESTRPRFAYIPFGGGPRGCIGNQFAMLEAMLIVAAIAQRFRIELVPRQPIRPEPLLTLRPAPGIRARLHKRSRDH